MGNVRKRLTAAVQFHVVAIPLSTACEPEPKYCGPHSFNPYLARQHSRKTLQGHFRETFTIYAMTRASKWPGKMALEHIEFIWAALLFSQNVNQRIFLKQKRELANSITISQE